MVKTIEFEPIVKSANGEFNKVNSDIITKRKVTYKDNKGNITTDKNKSVERITSEKDFLFSSEIGNENLKVMAEISKNLNPIVSFLVRKKTKNKVNKDLTL